MKPIPFVNFEVSKDVRCAQAGDWKFTPEGGLIVTAVPLADPRHSLLIQFHEFVEAATCQHRGITDEEVTAFDTMFEEERSKGLHSETEEDGDDPRAPYFREHQLATILERVMAANLDVGWKEYEQAISAYFQHPENKS